MKPISSMAGVSSRSVSCHNFAVQLAIVEVIGQLEEHAKLFEAGNDLPKLRSDIGIGNRVRLRQVDAGVAQLCEVGGRRTVDEEVHLACVFPVEVSELLRINVHRITPRATLDARW